MKQFVWLIMSFCTIQLQAQYIYHQTVYDGGHFELLALEDLNGDGYADFFFDSYWLENDGQGNPGVRHSWDPVYADMSNPVFGDFDGNGHMDYIGTVPAVEGSSVLFSGQGDGEFSLSLVNNLVAVYANDFDGDGDDDLLCEVDDKLWYLESNGAPNAANLIETIVPFNNIYHYQNQDLVDIDGDGIKELVFSLDGLLQSLSVDGSGIPSTTEIGINGAWMNFLQVQDLNQDGFMDYVFAQEFGDVQFFLGSADGTFDSIIESFPMPTAMQVGDFHSHPGKEIILRTLDYYYEPSYLVLTLTNTNVSTLATLTTLESESPMRVADLNIDGYDELCFETFSGFQLQRLAQDESNQLVFETIRDLPLRGSFYCSSFDYDLDGDRDIFAWATLGGNLGIIDCENGLYSANVQVIHQYDDLRWIEVADLDEDGLAEIYFSSINPGSPGLFRLELDQEGNVVEETQLQDAAVAVPQLADYDGNGKPDLIYNANDHYHVFLNDGNGLAETPELLLEDSPQDASLADWDADGDQDILQQLPNDELVLHSNNNGSLEAVEIETIFMYDYISAFLHDFNGDGLIDMLYKEQSSGNTAIGLQQENGDFQSEQSFPQIDGHLLIVIRDIDYDGDLDFVDRETLYENDGNGYFTQKPMGFGLSLHPSYEFADFDGEGSEDVLVQKLDGLLQIFRNTNGPILTRLEDFYELPEISLFPNPASGSCQISFPAQTHESTLYLFDTQGRQFFSGHIPAGADSRVLDTGTLSSGLYLVLLKGEEELVGRGRLLVP